VSVLLQPWLLCGARPEAARGFTSEAMSRNEVSLLDLFLLEKGWRGVSHTSQLKVQQSLQNGHPCCVGHRVRSSLTYWHGGKRARGRKTCSGM